MGFVGSRRVDGGGGGHCDDGTPHDRRTARRDRRTARRDRRRATGTFGLLTTAAIVPAAAAAAATTTSAGLGWDGGVVWQRRRHSSDVVVLPFKCRRGDNAYTITVDDVRPGTATEMRGCTQQLTAISMSIIIVITINKAAAVTVLGDCYLLLYRGIPF